MEFRSKEMVQYFSDKGWVRPSIHPIQILLPLSFRALLNSSISFLMLRSSSSILEESSPKVLSRLLAWEFNSSSFWFSLVRQCSAFWDSIVFCNSSFWRVNSSTLVRRAWICCYCTASDYYAVSGSILYFEELFCHWERLEWLAFPTDAAKLMMQKINSWAPRHNGWTKLWLGSSLLEENLQKWTGWTSNMPMWH